jgi:hypothetical protein
MNNQLEVLLTKIGKEFEGNISNNSRHYVQVSIGHEAEKLGFSDMKEDYKDACAIVPLREPLGGMKVRIDGRTFVNYVRLDSGAVVPEYIAMRTGLHYEEYEANDSMILNFN